MGKPKPNFSFSGLKTALRMAAEATAPLSDQDVADLAAGFQAAVVDTLVDRTDRAMALFMEDRSGLADPVLVIAGGVAANQAIRTALDESTHAAGFRLVAPPSRLCSDNAVMIAWAGAERLSRGNVDPLDTPARPRWPLDAISEPLLGAGAKGAKA